MSERDHTTTVNTEILTELVRHEVTLNELAKSVLASIATINKSIDEIKIDIKDNNRAHIKVHEDLEQRIRILEDSKIENKTTFSILIAALVTAAHFLFDYLRGK